jgi:hypothetical protein
MTGCHAAKAIDPASMRRVLTGQLGIVHSEHCSLFQQSGSTRKASFGGRVTRSCQHLRVSTDLMQDGPLPAEPMPCPRRLGRQCKIRMRRRRKNDQNVILSCPQWAEARRGLRAAAGDRWGDVPYLLGGCGTRKDVRTGQALDGSKEKWKPDLAVSKATIQFLEKTRRLPSQHAPKRREAKDCPMWPSKRDCNSGLYRTRINQTIYFPAASNQRTDYIAGPPLPTERRQYGHTRPASRAATWVYRRCQASSIAVESYDLVAVLIKLQERNLVVMACYEARNGESETEREADLAERPRAIDTATKRAQEKIGDLLELNSCT